MLPRYGAVYGPGGDWVFTVHNKYLLVWAETGIPGMVTFLVFLMTTLRRGWRVWTAGDAFLAPLALAFTAAVVGHMIHMSADLFSGRFQLQLLWLVAALIHAMYGMTFHTDDRRPLRSLRTIGLGGRR